MKTKSTHVVLLIMSLFLLFNCNNQGDVKEDKAETSEAPKLLRHVVLFKFKETVSKDSIAYAKGIELKGKTLGVLGFGRIGQATAKIALSIGMKVVAFDPFIASANLELEFYDGQKLSFEINTISKEDVLRQCDFLTLHVPAQDKYVISTDEFNMMKKGAGIVNAARGGVIDEVALVEALKSGKISKAALDVFENEPTPEVQLLMNPDISLTPHIGAATGEAQDRIGAELADQIIDILN